MSLSSTGQTILFIFEQSVNYLSFIILISGLIGNFLNIFIFINHKSFHKNQCVYYLIIASVIDYIQLLVTFTSRIGIIVFKYDPSQTSLVWCKIRSMIAQACTLISMTTVCFAVIDQYLSTNHRPGLRRMSSIGLAQTLMCINISVWLLHGIPFVLYFKIQPLLGCASSSVIFSLYYKFFHLLILIGLLPIIIGSTFSLLAYRNVRHLIRRQISHIQRRLDRQLSAMVLIRVMFMVIVTLPFVAYRMYSLIIIIDPTDSVRKRIETLISNSIFLIFAMNFSGSFYVFFISSSRFRRQIKYVIFKKYLRRYFSIRFHYNMPQRNRIVPLPNTFDISM